MQEDRAIDEAGVAKLLESVAEQLKLPLTVIARQSELVALKQVVLPTDMAAIHMHAKAALTLVDSYLLGLQLLKQRGLFELEPVSVSSMLIGIAHELDGFAKQHDAQIKVVVAGKYGPVMAHPQGFRSAFLALGYALLEQYPVKNGSLTLAVHRAPGGLIAGLYGDYEGLTTDQWRQALRLHGVARQPLRSITSGNAAGIFVAEAILEAMSTNLRVGRYRLKHGLATTLQLSQQLRFV